jgi:hexulose-6-phosphate isomerase
MQGRLVPPVDGRIQAFPREGWRDEIRIAGGCGLPFLEWTLDAEGLDENPLLRADGRDEIRELCRRFELGVPSITGDCFMQAPFWKAEATQRKQRLETFACIADAAGALGAELLVVPVVDDAHLETPGQRASLINGLLELEPLLERVAIRVLLESDLSPGDLASLVAPLDERRFGINYDIGNSASYGHDPAQEITAYGRRIGNVHVKDRRRGGPTVPLGAGDADLPRVIGRLESTGYRGRYVLQTARDPQGRHAEVIAAYREQVQTWIEEAR